MLNGYVVSPLAVLNFLRMYYSMLQFISLFLSCLSIFGSHGMSIELLPFSGSCSQIWSYDFSSPKWKNFGCRNSLPAHWQITFLVMGWLTKILKGSSYKGHSHRKYGHDRTWDKPRDSVVITLLTSTKFLLFLLHIEWHGGLVLCSLDWYLPITKLIYRNSHDSSKSEGLCMLILLAFFVLF